jgi:hypothetical protein
MQLAARADVLFAGRGAIRMEWDEHLADKLREAVAKGGAAAGFDLLSKIGFAVEKEPEAGVGMRTRFGTGTEDGFTSTLYTAMPERPSGWPAEVPFVPGVSGSLTLFDRPGRGFSVQWWKVPDPSAAAQLILSECLAAGWRLREGSEVMPMPGLQTIVLERDETERHLSSASLKAFGFVQLTERRPGESCAIPPTRPAGL